MSLSPATARSPTRRASLRCATTCRSSTRPRAHEKPAAPVGGGGGRWARAWDAARELAAEIHARPDFGSLGEFGRIAVNVDTVYRHLDPTYTSPNVVEQFRRMAMLEQNGPSSAD